MMHGTTNIKYSLLNESTLYHKYNLSKVLENNLAYRLGQGNSCQ